MISILVFASVTWNLLSKYLVHLGVIQLTDAQRIYFESVTWSEYVFSGALLLLNLVAAIKLFFLRKSAFYLFSAAFGLSVIFVIVHLAMKGPIWVEAVNGTAAWVGAAMGWMVQLAICIYCWRLVRRGVLNGSLER